MPFADAQETITLTSAYVINWFGPDRPTEAIYIRPTVGADTVEAATAGRAEIDRTR